MKTTEKNIPISIDVGIPLLPEIHRYVMELRIYQKKSYKEIAKMLNTTESNVRNYVFRAKKKLKKLDHLLKNFNGNEEELKKLLADWHFSKF